MENDWNKLRDYDDFASFNGASKEDICDAEMALNLKFSEEYIEYLMTYGIVCANGHELTGIGNSNRLNVVKATIRAKERNSNISSDMYVVEDMQIDNIIILQNGNGDLFQTIANGVPQKIDMSLFKLILS